MQIMFSAGEQSGDLHASHLIREIKKAVPTVECFGIGGDQMQSAGMELFYHINEMSIVGFGEVIKHLPFIRRVFSHLRQLLQQRQPDLLILIDYPGFNLRLAKLAHQLRVPVMYYIIPQIWAWGYSRIKKLVRLVDRAAVILPFEEKMLLEAGLKATFVGHPLLDFIKPQLTRDEFLEKNHLKPHFKILGLLPGSRAAEIQRLLPEMLLTAQKLREKQPELQIIIAQSSNLSDSIYQSFLNNHSDIRLLKNQTYDIMHYADGLLITSGTATLEAALCGTPMIIVYRTSAVTYQIARALTRIEHVGLPNIIAGEEIVPEFIQHQFQAEVVASRLMPFIFDKAVNQAKRQQLQRVREKMGQPGAAQKAAQIALDLIEAKNW